MGEKQREMTTQTNASTLNGIEKSGTGRVRRRGDEKMERRGELELTHLSIRSHFQSKNLSF